MVSQYYGTTKAKRKEDMYLLYLFALKIIFWLVFYLFRLDKVLGFCTLALNLPYWLRVLCVLLVLHAVVTIYDSIVDYKVIFANKCKTLNPNNRQWFLDKVKLFIYTYILYTLLFLVVEYILGYNNWWILLAIIGNLFTFVTSVLFQKVVQLFYKIEVLDEGKTRERIIKFCNLQELLIDEIYVVYSNMSKAAISGIGRKKNLYLSADALRTRSLDEIESIVAHELGHKVYYHLEKELLMQVILSTIGSYLIYIFYIYGAIYFRIDMISVEGIPLFYLLWGIANQITEPIGLYFSRVMEMQADKFAINLIADPNVFISALAKDYQGNPSPSLLAYLLRYSHPTLEKRVQFCQLALAAKKKHDE